MLAESAVVPISLFKYKKQCVLQCLQEVSVAFAGIFWMQTAGAEFQVGVSVERYPKIFLLPALGSTNRFCPCWRFSYESPPGHRVVEVGTVRVTRFFGKGSISQNTPLE